MSDDEKAGVTDESLHIHQLPRAERYPLYSVVRCECGDKFYATPKGIFGVEWSPVGEQKTEIDGEVTNEEEAVEGAEEGTGEADAKS